ncbi:hypothetical protein RN001_002048 [Aquatica leii]|uniref:Dynein intermediate chain 2, ciliary n=1 Tax=Aquatica leii TaxID=1421715 RepID=A0AAN7PGL9_9COLE|nr:hypothetical protein RN001_002048 [Aquatica leii]
MPPAATPKKKGGEKTSTSGGKSLKKKLSKSAEDDEFEQWQKSKQLLKPPDQLELTDAELKEIIPRVLQSLNLQQPDSVVEFSFEQGEFIPKPSPGSAVLVFSQKGTYIHRETDEARKQLIAQGIDPSAFVSTESEEDGAEETTREEAETESDVTEEGSENVGGGETKEAEEEAKPQTGKKLTNQFNFCERAALTYKYPIMSRETQTVPPPTDTFSANILQWIIYDGYQQDYEAQQLEKELERQRREAGRMPTGKQAIKKATGKSSHNEAMQGRIYECWKTLERMLNLSTYDYIAKDYRYWEDPADEFREEEGTLLPLWKFAYDKTKRNTVTDLLWNPFYYDLFAVCLGFLDFMNPIKGGAVLLFTIKNPSFPDYICITESAVMCIDIHKKYPYMLVVGMYDGNVMVYNIQATCKEPAFQSNSVTQKHGSIVWEVKWVEDLPDGEMNFFSVSSDGKVNHWILMQNEFAVTTIINLYLEKEQVRGPDGTLVKRKACATCLTFHPVNPLIYLVGTEEGLIYKCSTAYSTSYLFTYQAHDMPVYRVDYNKLNADVFASCSADWRIKIWEDNRNEPLYVFDLGSCVGDVKWAPYSSTVFGAVTSKGSAYIFDINVNKYKPICVQPVVSRKKYKLTRIAFNNKLPIIICGDDKGCATALKLSPNLRLPCKPPKKQQHLDQHTLQLMKLDKLLSLVREPATLTAPPDPAGSTDS